MTRGLPSVAERVAAGAAFLDEHEPGWDQWISLDRLDLASACRCILGQLHHSYALAMDAYALTKDQPYALGFNLPPFSMDWDELDGEWHQLIEARRAEQ